MKRAELLSIPSQPLAKKIRKPTAGWMKPSLVADVEYRALIGEKLLRHPSF
jgi:bifunctional non-homologous end joining protein LigD